MVDYHLIKIYLASALIAAAPVWVLSSLILPIDENAEWYSYAIIYFFISVMGGVLGGFLLSRKLDEVKPLRIAAVMSALSYVFVTLIDILLGLEGWVDGSSIIGLATGFAIGSRVIELRRIKFKNKS